MMRDVPYIMGLILVVLGFIIIGGIWYGSDTSEDEAATHLNSVLRTSAINQVSPVSRTNPGHVYLNQVGSANMNDTKPDFETDVLSKIKADASKGESIVRFDYITNNTATPVPATIYTYDDEATGWEYKATSGIRPLNNNESIEMIRVRFRRAGHALNGSDPSKASYWSYQSTVEVSRSDEMEDLMVR